jgi:hypothetical protein
MRQLAGHIADNKAGHFNPDKFEDHYETALVQSEEAPRPAKPAEECSGRVRSYRPLRSTGGGEFRIWPIQSLT